MSFDGDDDAGPEAATPLARTPLCPAREERRLVFEAMVARNPADSWALHKLSLIFQEEYGDPKQAVLLLRRAIVANPNNAPAHNTLGYLLRKDDPAQAKIHYLESLKIDPQYGRAHKNLGLLYQHELKNCVLALQCFNQGIIADEDNASLYCAKASLLEEDKQWAEVQRCYEAAILADPQNPLGHFGMGRFHMQGPPAGRNVAAALACFEQAVVCAPNEGKYAIKLGKVAMEAGNDLLALKAFQTAAFYSPKKDWLRGECQRLRQRLQKEGRVSQSGDDMMSNMSFAPSTSGSESSGGVQSVADSGRSAAFASPDVVTCPAQHSMSLIYDKPRWLSAYATWACEECRKSIGGPKLRHRGALHCAICRYDLCLACSKKLRTGHIIPLPPRFLGSGGCGDVWQEYDATSGAYVAVKKIRAGLSRLVEREVALMKRFQTSEYVVKVFHVERDARSHEVRIVMELMEGSVGSLLLDEGPLHERTARKIIRDALCGLQELHASSVMHRDIKPDNLLLSRDRRAKLSDFGVSRAMDGGSTLRTTAYRGTPLYMAPEIASHQPKWTSAVDMWALGCTWVEMTTGQQPWKGVFDHYEQLHQLPERLRANPELRPRVPAHLSPQAKLLIAGLLEKDRKKRLTAIQLLKDAYFADSCDIAGVETDEDHSHRATALLSAAPEQQFGSTMSHRTTDWGNTTAGADQDERPSTNDTDDGEGHLLEHVTRRRGSTRPGPSVTFNDRPTVVEMMDSPVDSMRSPASSQDLTARPSLELAPANVEVQITHVPVTPQLLVPARNKAVRWLVIAFLLGVVLIGVVAR